MLVHPYGEMIDILTEDYYNTVSDLNQKSDQEYIKYEDKNEWVKNLFSIYERLK